MVIRVRSLSTKTSTWRLALPLQDFEIEKEGEGWSGYDERHFSKLSWALAVEGVDVSRSDDATIEFQLADNQEAIILYSLTTHFDGQDYVAQALDAVTRQTSFRELKRLTLQASAGMWSQMGSILLPEGDYAKWFYRSLYFLVSTAGADHFLPGELQFSIPTDWDMHAFTYGHAGWSTLAFASMGHRDKAYRMAKWHYQPEALRANVDRIFPQQGEVDLSYRGENRGKYFYLENRSPEAIAFGHELTAFGYDVTYPNDAHWDWQRHLDGFAAAMYQTISSYYPDPEFEMQYSYPVLKGTAELWRSLLIWDDDEQIFYLPPLLSLSENIMEKSVLDAVLSAKWNLNAAARAAERLNLDLDLAKQWAEASEKLYIPEDDDLYLEYLGDDGTREGGGYFGIRAAAYLGYPTREQIPSIDRSKARRTLDKVWARNRRGEGMITFVMNWFALTEAYLGYGDKALEISRMSSEVVDPSDATLGEAFDVNDAGEKILVQPYFLTGYSSFVLVPLSMMLQSYNDEIRLFPAMPQEWKDAAFYDLPAQGGLRVSAQWRDGRPKWVRFTKDGELLLERTADSDDFSSSVFNYRKIIGARGR